MVSVVLGVPAVPDTGTCTQHIAQHTAHQISAEHVPDMVSVVLGVPAMPDTGTCTHKHTQHTSHKLINSRTASLCLTSSLI
jgi:hypothetical protein